MLLQTIAGKVRIERTCDERSNNAKEVFLIHTGNDQMHLNHMEYEHLVIAIKTMELARSERKQLEQRVVKEGLARF